MSFDYKATGLIDPSYSFTGAAEPAYEAAKDSKKRRRIKDYTGSEDYNLNRDARTHLSSNTNDLYRNFAAVRWTINRHLDFVCDHRFRPRTGSEEIDKILSDFVTLASQREYFDHSGRFNRFRAIRLFEAGRVLNGDIFAVKTDNGYLQGIEGDRVRTPHDKILNGTWVQGLRLNRGRVTRYCINKRIGSKFQFERTIAAERIIPFGYFSRFDQYRGVSPIASAVNMYKDAYEGFDLTLARLKVEKFFGLAIIRNTDWGLVNDDIEPPNQSSVKLGDGPGFFDLNPGEDVKFLTSNDPGSDQQQFWDTVLAIAIKSLDIPFSFFREDYTNYNGNKIATTLYLNSVRDKRADVVDFLNEWLCWRIDWGIANGELRLPRSFKCDPRLWRWVPTGLPWFDPREISSDIDLVRSRMRSRTRIIEERTGEDWEKDVLPEIIREEELLQAAGVQDYLPAKLATEGEDDTETEEGFDNE